MSMYCEAEELSFELADELQRIWAVSEQYIKENYQHEFHAATQFASRLRGMDFLAAALGHGKLSSELFLLRTVFIERNHCLRMERFN